MIAGAWVVVGGVLNNAATVAPIARSTFETEEPSVKLMLIRADLVPGYEIDERLIDVDATTPVLPSCPPSEPLTPKYWYRISRNGLQADSADPFHEMEHVSRVAVVALVGFVVTGETVVGDGMSKNGVTDALIFKSTFETEEPSVKVIPIRANVVPG